MLGSRIVIHFPEVIEVDVHVELISESHYRSVKESVQKAVTEFFEQYRDEFGKPVILSRLYGYLDRQEFVLGIRSLSLDARGNELRRSREGDIYIPSHGVVVLHEVSVLLTLE